MFTHYNNATELSDQQYEQCYKLTRLLRGMYIGSGMGWDSREKEHELRRADMEFLILEEDSKVGAFASYIRATDDDDEDGVVTYLYELHVTKKQQGNGIGTRLLDEVKRRSVGVVMLTVFRLNKDAFRFYERHGFTVHDSYGGDGGSRKGWHILKWVESEG